MPTISRTQTIRALLVYFASIIVLGALLAPLVAWSGHGLTALWHWLPWDPETPFWRYFDRSIMIIALAGLWPLSYALGLRSWSDIGFGPNKNFLKQILIGIVIAAASVLIFRVATHKADEPIWLLGNWTLTKRLWTAPVVACIEETFFRGLLLAGLLRSFSPGICLTATSLFFSAVHFLKPPRSAEIVDIHALSGFDLLPSCFAAFAHPAALAPYFVSLALAGLILGWAFWKTRSLAMPIGLHAGWVFTTAGKSELPWAAIPALLVAFALVIWLTRRNPPSAIQNPKSS